MGTAEFFAGEVTAGLEHHRRAKELLDARRDLRLWLRFHRSAASMRLDAGIVEGVPELVRTAALGLQILGNKHDVVELRQVEAKLALLNGDPTECARIMSGVLDDPVLGAPDISRGASELLLAEALLALGRPDAARERFIIAGREFEVEGRLKAAVDAWRLGVGEEVSAIS
jgi:hypothetical protein